ncbi:MAG: porin family protein [Bacteroidota bacterium]
MKRLVMVWALLCPLAIIGLNAQQSSFYIGARAGVNTSKFKFTEDLKELYPTTHSIFGVNGGLDMGLHLNKWTISTGLHYVQKGSEYQTDNFEENGTVGYFTARERLHYVTILLLLGYRDYLANRIGWSIAIGPSFNFGLGGKVDETTEYFGTDETDVQNFKVAFGEGVNEDYKSQQVGFQISPGIFLELNERSKLLFNITWDLGTADIFNPRYKDANDFFNGRKGNQTNRTAMFTIGYEYHFNFEDKY